MSAHPVIDVHAHAVFPETFGLAGSFGPELGVRGTTPFLRIGEYVLDGVRYEGRPLADHGVRLELMDRDGIDIQLLSPLPLFFFHRIPAADAQRFCRANNDAMAATVRDHPDRFRGTALLPMQDLDAAIAELERAVTELGLLGGYVGTDFGFLGDRRLDPFYEACVALDAPLFVHASSTGGETTHDDPRMDSMDFGMILGYAHEETVAVASLVFGGVPVRHPELDVCISHGGGSVPYLLGRLERAARLRPWVPEEVRRDGFGPHLRRLWFDVHLNHPGALALLIDAVGTERLVHGTNFGGWDAGGDHAGELDALQPTLSTNGRRLLRLDR